MEPHVLLYQYRIDDATQPPLAAWCGLWSKTGDPKNLWQRRTIEFQVVQRRLGWHTSVAALPDASETTAVCAPRAPLLGWDGLYSCSSEASLPELLSGCVAQLCCFDVFDSTCSTARMDGNRDIKTKNAGELGQSNHMAAELTHAGY